MICFFLKKKESGKIKGTHSEEENNRSKGGKSKMQIVLRRK